jgi:mono/diheme cytochrome c family protein
VNRRFVKASLIAVAAIAQSALWGQANSSTRDGVYTDEQATKGQASYAAACASCHGKELQGSGAAMPPLSGPGFEMNWQGQTLNDLVERIQTSMPADSPGRLSRTETADITAYILKINKLPAGKQPLPADAERLKAIRFEAAKR